MISAILLQVNQGANVVTDTLNRAINQLPITATQPSEISFSILELVQKGGWIMLPIGLLSIITIYIFIERYVVVRIASHQDANFMSNIRDFIYQGRIDSALAFCKNSNRPISRMIEKGIKRISRPMKEIEESIEIVGKFEVYKLEKNLVILAIIAGIAPMFGFIGTIIGVIKIFHDISLAGDVSITSVSAGLYTKMVSSAAGLMVGIIAFVCYHWLNIMIEKVVQRLEQNAMEFMDLLQEPAK